MRQVPDFALDFLKRVEGCRLTAYPDTGGVLTIGVGHTGPEVHTGQVISPDQAMAYLADDAAVAATRLADVVHPDVVEHLTDHQYAALVSFVFNLGANPKWTIWKVLNANQPDQVTQQIMRFDRGRLKRNGPLVVIPGLEHRRAAEVQLWTTADVAAATAVVSTLPPQMKPSSAVTRTIETPPAPDPTAKPIVTSKTFAGGAATAVLGALEVAKQGATNVQDIAKTQATAAPWMHTLIQDAGVAIVAIGIAIMAIRWLDEQAKRR